jgi:hypothetical protein
MNADDLQKGLPLPSSRAARQRDLNEALIGLAREDLGPVSDLSDPIYIN